MEFFHLKTLQTLRGQLAQHYQLYQAQTDGEGEVHWDVCHRDAELLQPANLPLSSPKQLFFPERDNVFVFDGECFRETLPMPAPFALVGVSSCDLKAIAYQDQFFADDPYYQARRKQALLVGIDCLTPCENGFCNSVDAGPGVDTTCADIILHPQPDGQFLMLVCSEKGHSACANLLLPHGSDNAFQQRQKNIDDCVTQFQQDAALLQGIEDITRERVPLQLWEDAGLQCLSCSGCTSLCPTCSCYATRDQPSATGEITQQRFWDSCLFESFQREASQHNPSHEAGERVFRFWNHKFSAATMDEFGRYGCVGCGRCEQTCPGVIGAVSLLKRIANHAKPDAGCS